MFKMDGTTFTSLRMQNFRSYEDYAVELSPNVNIIVGPNASGKTNLLESMLIICGSSSYRTGYDNLIKKGQDWSRVDSTSNNESRVVKLLIKNGNLEKVYEINEKPKKRLNFKDIIPSVLFEPEDMRLLTGPPDLRREFFDSILIETNPSFELYKNQYKRTLVQRNHLLKYPDKMKNQIFAWDVRLSELAGKIVEARTGLVKVLNKSISSIYSQIADTNTKIKIKYDTNLDTNNYESSLVKALEKSIELDVLRGYTYFGPHREDFSLHINKDKAGFVASRGETRTLVLSLKLLEIRILEEKRNQKPLVLLDDVFSELDGSRRKALTNYLNDYQVLITTTDADIIQKNFAQTTNRISLG